LGVSRRTLSAIIAESENRLKMNIDHSDFWEATKSAADSGAAFDHAHGFQAHDDFFVLI
jgi:hypothetical protein